MTGYTRLFTAIFLFSLCQSSFAQDHSRWRSALALCGKAIAGAVQALRNDPTRNVPEAVRTLANQEVPATGNRWIDLLAAVRPYINPAIASWMTRGLSLAPDLTRGEPLPPPDTDDEEVLALWDALLDEEMTLDEFEDNLFPAQRLLALGDRARLARYFFFRGVRQAWRNPDDRNADLVRRAITMVRNDPDLQTAIGRHFVGDLNQHPRRRRE